MADASLEYALRIDKRAALNDVEDFIAKANKKLGKIKTPDLSGGSSGGSNHGLAVGSRTGDDLKKKAKSWEEISKAIDETTESTKELTAEENRLVKAFKAMEPAQKKYVSGSRDIVKAVQKQGDEERKAASKRVDLFDAIGKANEKHRAEEAAAEAAAYKDRVKMQAAEAKERQSLETQKNAILAQATRFRIQKGIQSTDQQKALEMQLTAIVKKAGTERISALKEEMRTRLVEFRKGMQQQQKTQAQLDAEVANRENAKAKNWGRASLIGFQVQQSIEDFQFAGMRGAANNIALMAARLGGPAGLIALAGLAGYQLKSMYDVWKNGDKSLQEAIRGTENYINRLKELRELEQGRREAGRDMVPAATGAERIEQRGDLAFSEQDEQAARRSLASVQQQQEALTNLYAARKKVSEIDNFLKVPAVVGATLHGGPKSYAEKKDQAIADRARLLEQASRLEEELQQQGVVVPSLEGQDWEQQKAALTDIRKKHQDVVKAAQEDLDKAAEKTREMKNQVMLSNHLHMETARRASLEKRMESLDFNDADAEKLANIESQFMTQQKLLTSQLNEASTLQRKATVLEQIRQLYDQHFMVVNRIVSAEEQKVQAIERSQEALKRAADIGGRAASLAERAAAAEERKAEAARKTATALFDQARHSRDQFKGEVFDARRSIESQKQKEQLDRALRTSEAGLRKRFRRQFGEGTAEQNQALERMIQDRAENIRKASEAAGRKADEKLIKARESDLIQSGLSKLKAGETAGKSGNLELAGRLFQEGREHLEELKRLQLSKASGMGAAAGEKGLKDAATTQAAIEKSLLVEGKINADQAKLSNQKATALQQVAAQVNQIKAQADSLEIIKEADIKRADALIQRLDMLTKKIQGMTGLPQSGLKGGEAGVKGKAAGGYVSKGNPYVVGEAGMELFIPSQNGRIATALETRQMLQSIGLPAAMAAISQQRNPSPVSSSINNRFGEINVNLHGSTVSDMKNALLSEAKAQGLRRG